MFGLYLGAGERGMGIHKVTRGERRWHGCSPVGFPHGCMYVYCVAESHDICSWELKELTSSLFLFRVWTGRDWISCCIVSSMFDCR